MSEFDVDLFVIGGGSGGVRCARIAAGHGAKVAIAESSRWGGTCVIRGCVPKKLMVYASEIGAIVRDARGFGWEIVPPRHNWAALTEAVEREVTRLSGIYDRLLDSAGVERIEGHASIVDPHTLEVNGRSITAAHIVIATGGRPVRPELGANWLVSDDVFHLPTRPERLAIVGGGYIALEFAHVFAGLGTAVTLIHRDRAVLRGFDSALREAAAAGLAEAGIEARFDNRVVAAEPTGAGDRQQRLTLSDGSHVDCDAALAAIGRTPNTEGLGLSTVGIAQGPRGEIVVDSVGRTSLPHVFAVGDVIGQHALTPIAIREGHAVADLLFANGSGIVDKSQIPTAVFAQPPLATVGLSEDDARARGDAIDVFRTTFRPMRNVLPGRSGQVLIKMVVERDSRRIIGLHMAGIDSPEILQAAAIAIRMGARKEDFDRTIAIHPTTAEELVLLR